MTDSTQPEALRLADWLQAAVQTYPQMSEDEPGGYASEVDQIMDEAAAELRRQHARIAELEAQLESIGAGGVSGPLMGQPQAPLGGRWYMVTHDGAATLCIDQEDAQAEAVKADRNWPHMGPHRAVQLVEVASVAASAGSEPVAYLWQHSETGRTQVVMPDMVFDAPATWRPVGPLYLHPSPPEGMVGGWTKASQQLPPCRDDQLYIGINTAGFAGVFNVVRVIHGNTYCLMEVAEESVSIMSDLDIWQPFTPPTTSAGSGKGE